MVETLFQILGRKIWVDFWTRKSDIRECMKFQYVIFLRQIISLSQQKIKIGRKKNPFSVKKKQASYSETSVNFRGLQQAISNCGFVCHTERSFSSIWYV